MARNNTFFGYVWGAWGVSFFIYVNCFSSSREEERMQRLEEQAKKQHINFADVVGDSDAVGFINELTKMAEDRSRRMSLSDPSDEDLDGFSPSDPDFGDEHDLQRSLSDFNSSVRSDTEFTDASGQWEFDECDDLPDDVTIEMQLEMEQRGRSQTGDALLSTPQEGSRLVRWISGQESNAV